MRISDWSSDVCSSDLTGLADRRVAIIGTGATAVQCIPHLARSAGELYVFQRTPSSVDARGNQPTDPEWFAGIAEPGWQRSEEHTSELQSLMRISYAVFCLQKTSHARHSLERHV